MRECTGSIRKFGKDKSSEKYICSSSSVGIAHDSAVYRFIKSLYLLYFSCLATALSYSRAATISRIKTVLRAPIRGRLLKVRRGYNIYGISGRLSCERSYPAIIIASPLRSNYHILVTPLYVATGQTLLM